ncbi:zinc-binding dehydrogenase [Ottowia pentelensis]
MGTRSELADLLSFCVQAGIHPRIGAELPMTEAAQAFQLMMAGETGGKVVLTR